MIRDLFICMLIAVILCAFCLVQANPKDQLIYGASSTSMHGVVGQASLLEISLIAPIYSEAVESEAVEPDTVESEIGNTLRTALSPLIHKQLQYLVGNLNEIGGGLELHAAHIYDVHKVKELDHELAQYRYSVEIDAVITNSAIPIREESTYFQVFLPKKVDEVSIQTIFDRYAKDCNPNPHRIYKSEFYWYNFRPNSYYCPLNQSEQNTTSNLVSPSEHMLKVSLKFDAFPLKEHDSYPEYDKIWSDGKLVVTAVYALVGGLLGEQGQEGYQMVFKDLIRTYGKPTYINRDSLLSTSWIDVDTPVIDAIFDTPKGPLEIHLFLINSLDTPSHMQGDELETFFEDYNAFTQYSDLVIYNGHARHGQDNAKLDQLGIFSPNHYQLFYVNTCGSYTYGLPKIYQNYIDLNQSDSNPNAFLDLVVNAMPAMGHEIAFMNMRYINALVNTKESYQSILSSLYAQQQMLVLYDQDNQWQPRLETSKMDGTLGESDLRSKELLQKQTQKQSFPTHRSTQKGCDMIGRETGVISNAFDAIYGLLLFVMIGLRRACRKDRSSKFV